MTRFKKHLGEGKELEIEGEKYIIKPLTTDEAPLFFKLMKLFDSKNGDIDIDKLDKETSSALTSILNLTLQKSFPDDWNENEQECKEFGMRYMMELFTTIMEVNIPNTNEEKNNKIDELKNKLQNK